MTREEIIRMAEQCGIPEFENYESQAENIMRFAALVAAAERERIKQKNAPVIEQINEHIKALEDAVAAEREACAKVCDELSNKHTWEGCYADECAQAIRARGQI